MKLIYLLRLNKSCVYVTYIYTVAKNFWWSNFQKYQKSKNISFEMLIMQM